MNGDGIRPVELITEIDRLLAFVPRACHRDFMAELGIQVSRVYSRGYDDGQEDLDRAVDW